MKIKLALTISTISLNAAAMKHAPCWNSNGALDAAVKGAHITLPILASIAGVNTGVQSLTSLDPAQLWDAGAVTPQAYLAASSFMYFLHAWLQYRRTDDVLNGNGNDGTSNATDAVPSLQLANNGDTSANLVPPSYAYTGYRLLGFVALPTATMALSMLQRSMVSADPASSFLCLLGGTILLLEQQ